MQKRAAQSDGGPLKVGGVVQVAVDEVDRGKVDDSNATLVIVELVVTGTKRKETKYRLAGPRQARSTRITVGFPPD